MSMRHGVVVVILSLAAATGWAQQEGGRAGQPPGDRGMQQAPGIGVQPPRGMMGDAFFPPELVMRNQQAIGLTDDQRTTIKTAMQKMMAGFTDLQWQQSADEEALTALVKQQPVDEDKALATFDKLLGIENQVKRMQFAMMVEVKNTLTANQQAKLRELQRQDRRGGQPNRGPDDRGGADRGPGQPPPDHAESGDRQGNAPKPPDAPASPN